MGGCEKVDNSDIQPLKLFCGSLKSKKLLQIHTILYICIEKVAGFAVYICGN